MRSCLLILFVASSFGGEPLFREEFANLDNWQPLLFPNISSHSSYAAASEGELSILHAESKAAASGLRHVKTFDPHTHPMVSWRWKINGVLAKGNAAKKEGDDYPIRIYIMFKYDPTKASFGKRALFRIAKARQGEYPPGSTLNYIWANRPHSRRIIPNAYTEYAQMIVLQAGAKKAGQWITETINILDDYKAAYGKTAPREASLAIMVDTDNTGESVSSAVDFIEVRKD
jgi:hypothetical protein